MIKKNFFISPPLFPLPYYFFFFVCFFLLPFTPFPPTSDSPLSERTPRTADSSKKPYSGRRRRRGYSGERGAARDATSDLCNPLPPTVMPTPYSILYTLISDVLLFAVKDSRMNLKEFHVLNYCEMSLG